MTVFGILDGEVSLKGRGLLSHITGRTDADGVLASLEVRVGGAAFTFERVGDE